MIDQDLYAALAGNVAVAALVGVAIYPLVAPQDKIAPFIVYQQIGRNDVSRKLSGPGDLVSSRMQIDSYGATYTAAKALAKAVRQALDGYTGGNIQEAELDTETDLYEGDDHPRLFRVSQDYQIFNEE